MRAANLLVMDKANMKYEIVFWYYINQRGNTKLFKAVQNHLAKYLATAWTACTASSANHNLHKNLKKVCRAFRILYHNFGNITHFIVFSNREWAEFNRSINLIGSWGGRNFLIRTPQRAESVLLIYFRERISGNGQSFAFFTLPLTINQSKFISIHL